MTDTVCVVPSPKSEVVVADQKPSAVTEMLLGAISLPPRVTLVMVEPGSTVPVITGFESFVRALLVIAKTAAMFSRWVASAISPARSLT